MELLKQTIKEIKAIDTMYLDKKEVLKRLSLIEKELDKRSGQLNLEKLDKAFDSILKGYDKDKLQDWIDGKV
jgi:hypothetical protein